MVGQNFTIVQVYTGTTPVFLWSTLWQPLTCLVGTAGKEKGLEWLDPPREGTLPLPWQSPRAQRLNIVIKVKLLSQLGILMTQMLSFNICKCLIRFRQQSQ